MYRKDYFTQQENSKTAGKRILIDLWGSKNPDGRSPLEKTPRDTIDAADATLLHFHIHPLIPTGGLSGTAILAESQSHVHTWPERGFAAFDVFKCGNTKPEKVEPGINHTFHPERSTVELRHRGEIRKNIMKTG